MDQRSCPVLLLFFSPPLTFFFFSFFVFLFLQPLFCSHFKMSHCFSVIMLRFFFFFFCCSRPTIQGTCDSLLLLSGNPITPTIYLSSSHSILCLCLFNTRWSCLPGIGCLRCDAERFPIDGMERMGTGVERGESKGEVIELEEKREEAKSMGEQSVLVQKASGQTIYHRERQTKLNGNWKDFSGVLGIHFSWEIAQFCTSVLKCGT